MIGPWRYLRGAGAFTYDVHNVRPVRMLTCGVESSVPGAVISSFIGGWALQRVHGPGAMRIRNIERELTEQGVEFEPADLGRPPRRSTPAPSTRPRRSCSPRAPR